MNIKRLLFTIALGLAPSLLLQAQNLDFEKTGFEIKAVAIQEEKSALAYHVSETPLPSKFVLGPVLQEKRVSFTPVIQENNPVFRSGKAKDPVITIAPLKQSEIFAFGTDGRINRVKNIAYKPASGGNIADAYCRAIYASRNSN